MYEKEQELEKRVRALEDEILKINTGKKLVLWFAAAAVTASGVVLGWLNYVK